MKIRTHILSFFTRSLVWGGLLLSGLALLPQADAMTVVRMSDAELVEKSTLVIRGKVIKKQSKWVGNKTTIITQITIEVQEEILGRKAPQTVMIGHYGGTVGKDSMGLEFAPAFALKEEVLVFVYPNKHIPNEYLLTGWTQGKWTIRRPESTNEFTSTTLPLTVHRSWVPTRLVVPKGIQLKTPLKQTRQARQETLTTFRTRLQGYWKNFQQKTKKALQVKQLKKTVPSKISPSKSLQGAK